jgi:hypothetical protein
LRRHVLIKLIIYHVHVEVVFETLFGPKLIGDPHFIFGICVRRIV